MKESRANAIINNPKITEIYYNGNPVWIQEINNHMAKIGFLNGSSERNIFFR